MPQNIEKSTKPAGAKRGVKAFKYIFTRKQDKVISDYCQYLKDNIHNHLENPKKPLRDPKLTAWKKATTETILTHEDFLDLDKSVHTDDGWRVIGCQGIMNRFTNFFNTQIKPGLLAGSANSPSASASADQDRLLRTFALLSNDLSGREFYARENAQLLHDTTEEIYEDLGYSIPKGAARNKALTQLWDSLTSSEKNNWKERAETCAMDIESNRENFPHAIGAALQSVVERGRLGTVVVGISYAFRAEDGGVDSGSVQVGTNVLTGKPISAKVDNPEWQSIWRDHAKEILPVLPPKQLSFVKLGDDATPLFPDIDLKKSTPEHVALIVEDYITKLWAKASPADRRSIVLWDRVNNEAAFYYDDEKFKLPGKLRPAAQYDDVAELYNLVKYFDHQQRTGSPFKFTRFNELPTDSEPEDEDPLPARMLSKKKRAVVVSDDDESAEESDIEEPVPPQTKGSAHASSNSVENPMENTTSMVSETGEKPDPSMVPTNDNTPEHLNALHATIVSSATVTDTTGNHSDPQDQTDLHAASSKAGSTASTEGVKPISGNATATKKSRAVRPRKSGVALSSQPDPKAPRALRKRGPTGVAIPSTPPKRIADLVAVDGDAEEEGGIPARKRRKVKGWAYVQDEGTN